MAAGSGNFRCAAEAAVLRIEHPPDALEDRLHDPLIGCFLPSLEVIHLAESSGNLRGALVDLVALGAIIVCRGFQQPPRARAAGWVIGWGVSVPKERLAVGSEKSRERPPPLARQALTATW